MKKDKKIELRVTEGEKELIEKKATENGETVSSYLLKRALSASGSTDAKLRKAIVTMLCRLNLVSEASESVQLRSSIKELEAPVWRCLK